MRNFWFRLLSAPLPFPFSPPPLHPVYGLKGVGLTDAVHFFMKPWAMTTGAHDARRASRGDSTRWGGEDHFFDGPAGSPVLPLPCSEPAPPRPPPPTTHPLLQSCFWA